MGSAGRQAVARRRAQAAPLPPPHLHGSCYVERAVPPVQHELALQHQAGQVGPARRKAGALQRVAGCVGRVEGLARQLLHGLLAPLQRGGGGKPECHRTHCCSCIVRGKQHAWRSACPPKCCACWPPPPAPRTSEVLCMPPPPPPLQQQAAKHASLALTWLFVQNACSISSTGVSISLGGDMMSCGWGGRWGAGRVKQQL